MSRQCPIGRWLKYQNASERPDNRDLKSKCIVSMIDKAGINLSSSLGEVNQLGNACIIVSM